MATNNKGTIASLRQRAAERWKSIKERRPGVRHVVTAYQRYQDNHGDHLAAAITYFSFLALFPLILLGVSVVGFILANNTHLQNELFDSIARNLPGDFGTTVSDAIDSAVRRRASVGIIGLVGVTLAGLGWIANLRTAIDTVWGLPKAKRSFIGAKLSDALVLLGLGLGAIVSIALTAGGTSATGFVLRESNLNGVTGAGTAARILGILLAIVGSMIIFGWLLIRLPAVEVSRATAFRATLLASIGFEILKIGGSYYISRATQSPAVAVIAPVLGILIWIDLVSRYLLYCVAWAATAEPGSRHRLDAAKALAPIEHPHTEQAEVGEAPGEVVRPLPSLSPIAIAASLFSAGAAVGGATVAALQRRRRARVQQER